MRTVVTSAKSDKTPHCPFFNTLTAFFNLLANVLYLFSHLFPFALLLTLFIVTNTCHCYFNTCLAPLFIATNTCLLPICLCYSNTCFPNFFITTLTLTFLLLLFLSYPIPIDFLAFVIYSTIFSHLIVSIHFRQYTYYFAYNYKNYWNVPKYCNL